MEHKKHCKVCKDQITEDDEYDVTGVGEYWCLNCVWEERERADRC